jgi:hypothetical protein
MRTIRGASSPSSQCRSVAVYSDRTKVQDYGERFLDTAELVGPAELVPFLPLQTTGMTPQRTAPAHAPQK